MSRKPEVQTDKMGIHSVVPFRWFRLSEQIDRRGRNGMNSVLRRPGYQRQGVPDVPAGWPSAEVPVLSPSPVRLKQVLSQMGDQVVDSAPLVCDDERLS